MATETKTTLTSESIATLQDLVQVNIDSRDGFQEAIEHVDDANISALFIDLARQRNEQCSELRTLVSANSEEPKQDGTLSGDAHQAWMNLRAMVGGGTKAMLNEAERGEDHIKAKYEEALKAIAGSAVTDVLNRHYVDVKAAHDRVRDLRDQYND